MKKRFIYFAAAAAMLAGCSETDELAKNQLSEVAEDGAVSFSVYTNRATRAGEAGVMTTDALKGTANEPGPGFGIFAYHTNNSKYDERTSTPNFMYNQQVKWDAAKKWTYDPVKYWPNEFGKNALSEDIDYVTFFAYAPYVAVSPTTGIPVVDYNGFDAATFAQFLGYANVEAFRAAEGYKDAGDAEEALKMLFAKQQQGKNVTALSRNADKGDPIVNYVVDTNPQTSVDLLWGVAAKDNGFKGLAAPEATVTEGNCYLDLSKQIGVSDSIKWRFYHALAKLNVQIIAASDIATQGTASYAANGADALAKATKIYLRSIDFTGFAMRGALNLHSEPVTTEYKLKPNWMNFDGTDLTASTVTFYDGLKDGKEGYTDNIATGEKPLGLNPELIEEPTTTTWAKKNQGIPTQQYANLFAGAKTADDAVFVIPTNERMAITVIYDVMTRDTLLNQNLSDGFTKGSRVQNKISQTLKDLKLEAGKAYTIKLVVGIESVKIDVKVEPWDTDEAAKDVDLPYNPAIMVSNITINGPSSLNVGEDGTFTATIEPVSATDATYTWSSSDPNIATVDQTGKVTAVAAGTVTIYAEANDGSGVKGECTVAISTVPVSSITLDKTAVTIIAGQTANVSVTEVLPANATDKTYTWSSDNEDIATVDQNGVITAVATGTANITATANDGSGKKATCTVTVKLTTTPGLSGYTQQTPVTE